MLRRLLNIASIVCLVLCVVLMGLWIRSCYSVDKLHGRFTARQVLIITSLQSRLQLNEYALTSDKMRGQPSEYWPWSLRSRANTHEVKFFTSGFLSTLGFDWIGFSVLLPYWFLVLTSGLLAMIFRMRWPPWRFSLRGLFIATTFLAVVLGMIIWLDRSWIGKDRGPLKMPGLISQPG
jgi:hypothetical protein